MWMRVYLQNVMIKTQYNHITFRHKCQKRDEGTGSLSAVHIVNISGNVIGPAEDTSSLSDLLFIGGIQFPQPEL
jgi:hypothetical protein